MLLALRARLERERDAMRRFALRDPLTGLANRRALDERLGYEIARHTRHGESFAVLALDLDGFKAVNDRFGHDAGDELLCEAAAALVERVRAQDTVVRLGGDEFCVLAPQTGRPRRAPVARVRAALAGVTAGLSGLSASIGTAVFPADGTTPEALLAAADLAALEAKRHPRSRARAAPGGVSVARRWLDRVELTGVRAAWSSSRTAVTATRRRSRSSRCSRSSRSRCCSSARSGSCFDDEEVRERVVTTVFDNVPLARERIATSWSAPSATRSRAPATSARPRSCC